MATGDWGTLSPDHNGEDRSRENLKRKTCEKCYPGERNDPRYYGIMGYEALCPKCYYKLREM